MSAARIVAENEIGHPGRRNFMTTWLVPQALLVEWVRALYLGPMQDNIRGLRISGYLEDVEPAPPPEEPPPSTAPDAPDHEQLLAGNVVLQRWRRGDPAPLADLELDPVLGEPGIFSSVTVRLTHERAVLKDEGKQPPDLLHYHVAVLCE